MAPETPITSWILDHKDYFRPEMVEYSWAKDFGLDIFDVQTKIYWNDRTFVGRGAANSLRLAIEKSCAETLERLAGFHNGISSIGVAAHSNRQAAEAHAKSEALERELLCTYMNNKISPIEMSTAEAYLPRYNLPVGTTSRRFHLSNQNDNSCLSIFKLEDQYFLGLSMAETKVEAIHKADLESLRNLAAFHSNKNEFKSQITKNSDLWCCDNQIIKTIMEGHAEESVFPDSNNWRTTYLTLPNEAIFHSAPVHIAFVKKEDKSK